MYSTIKLLTITSAIAFSGFYAEAQLVENLRLAFNLEISARQFINTENLNARVSSDKGSQILGQLSLNDEVEIIGTVDSKTKMVQVRILKSDDINQGQIVYVHSAYLSSSRTIEKSIEGISDSKLASQYFIVQNVATEKTRVYERCTTSPDCPHKLIFETENVVGRRTGDKDNPNRFLTWMGHYKVREWIKFYEDGAGHYPSWYDPEYPMVPKDASASDWVSTKYVPEGSNGHMRGAFGWFMAKVGPNQNEQWMHGTFGWGENGDKFIKYTRSFWVNMFADPRSSGCTRLENRAISYLRHIIPVGTDLFRVYAKEAYADEKLERYQSQKNPLKWEFILTKEGVRKSGAPTIDKETVLARQISKSEILEEGSYDIDQYPDAVSFKEGKRASSGKSGNSYQIKDDEFKGVFLIDEGRFVNYQHPKNENLTIGGFPEKDLPSDLKTDKPFTLPKSENYNGNQNNEASPFPFNSSAG